jgi:hypothetical protein
VKLTQVFDNSSPTTTGGGVINAWSTSYTSIGGMLSFMLSFSCYVPSYNNINYTFVLQIDGTTVDTINYYFNNTGVHLTVPSNFHVNAPLSVGSHTISLQIPTGISVDSNDRMNMTIQEFVGLS